MIIFDLAVLIVSWLLAVNLKTCKRENLQTRIYIPHPGCYEEYNCSSVALMSWQLNIPKLNVPWRLSVLAVIYTPCEWILI